MSIMLAGTLILVLLPWPIVVAMAYSARGSKSVAHPFLLFFANVVLGYVAMGIVGLLIGLNVNWENTGAGLLSLIFPFLAPILTIHLVTHAASSVPKDEQ